MLDDRKVCWMALVHSYIAAGRSYDDAARAADEVTPLMLERLEAMGEESPEEGREE